MTETLNIDYNIKQLVIKALNKFRYEHEAAAALKVSTRSLYRYKHRFALIRVEGVWRC